MGLSLPLFPLFFVLFFSSPPVNGVPTPALLWECSAQRSPFQTWTLTPGLDSSLISLRSNATQTLNVVGWNASSLSTSFSYNTPILSLGDGPTPPSTYLFSSTNGSLIITSQIPGVPPHTCVSPLYGVPFHGTGVSTQPCSGPMVSWEYNVGGDGTLRPTLNSSLCLDVGPPFNCSGPEGEGVLYCDASLPPAQRASDLASRLTPPEAALLLSSGMIVQPLNYGTNVGLPARGIPPLWWSECCHGAVAECGAPGQNNNPDGTTTTGCPTVFPAGGVAGGSLNATAWAAMGVAVSREARALYNQGKHGLGCFAPNVNGFRAPQWGRGPETVGEDWFISGEWGAIYTGGLQGEGDTSVLRVLATMKHAAAYDMENSDGQSRSSFNAMVSPRDLAEYYWAPFKPTAQRGRPAFLMASYNAVNGVPSCANGEFMDSVVRGDWGWSGATITDCGGLQQIDTAHHYTSTPGATLAVALEGGLDSECGDWMATFGAAAAASGNISLAQLQLAVTRTMTSWFRAGLLPSASAPDPYAGLGGNDVDTEGHRALALEMALQGAVLLRNLPVPATSFSDVASANGAATATAPILPLQASALKGRTLALIGPHANSTGDLLGPYSPPASPIAANNSLAQALGRRGAAEGFSVAVAQGCADIPCTSTAGFEAALAVAGGADVGVVVAAFGLNGGQEGEGHDRKSLGLPGAQAQLLASLVALGKPLVLVLIHGGAVALPDLSGSSSNRVAGAPPPVPAPSSPPLPAAILSLFYPGQAGGEAATRLLFGDVSPSGRTLITWYQSGFEGLRKVTDMTLGPHTNSTGGFVPGITYMWYNGSSSSSSSSDSSGSGFLDLPPPLFEFGTGGSYTTFEFNWGGVQGGEEQEVSTTTPLLLSSPPADSAATPPQYLVNVTNTGSVTSDVSVLAFVSSGLFPQEPLEEVFDFGRLAGLQPGETRQLQFTMAWRVLGSGRMAAGAADAALHRLGDLYLHPGNYSVRIGDVRSSGKFVETTLRVVGEPTRLPRH